ncbi:DUF937 domain-containing protein [Marinobacter sp.]|uniref:DUF937 domain-containing protein n=1 Tax=Marinobacter sp. TaxID=50741 RepID=UPI003A941107
MLPAILGGFKKQLQSQPGGVAGIGGLLGQLGGSDLLSSAFGQPAENKETGKDVLGQIFGSKDVSRTVAEDAAQSSGLSADLLKKMLPMLATMVAGFMAKQGGSGGDGGIGGMIGGLLGGSKQSSGSRAAGIMSMLDFDGDGNPLDDIMGMVGKGGRR